MSETLDSLFVSFQQALAGRYSLERELGRGGMGIVYLAREVRLDRPVAIKLLPPALAAHDTLRERFLREARTAARLSQPNIIPIFAVDEVGGFVFYAMAYVHGETLARRVATRGPLPTPEATRMLREVAWALGYAHARGVVHRDVKPENILLEHDSGRAMVGDFGIARLAQASGGTGFGEVLGTPEFMSPEQAAGEAVDGRSDLYSLGIVGYYAVTGRLPFEGANAAAVLAQQITRPAPAIATVAPAISRALAQPIERCLAKQPAHRFPSAEALAETLGDALEGRRDTPVAVRAFLRRMKMSVGIFFGAYLGLLPAILTHLRHLLLAGADPTSYPVLFLTFAAAAVLVEPPAFFSFQVRRLARHGYGPDDVALALRLSFERRREEYQFDHGPSLTLRERALRIVGASALGVAALTAGGILAGRLPSLAWGVAGASAYIGVVTAGVSFVAQRRRTGKGSLWAAFWSGRIGRWVFRVAGLGMRRDAAVAAGRPTEIALGSAAGVLFDALPKEARRALGDVPGTIRSLERQAQAIRRRIENLERSVGDTRQGPAAGASLAHRDALVRDLEAAREGAHRQLGDVVSALETIRLDLLRLRAGAGSVAGVTADLGAARELGEQTDRMLAAGSEVGALFEKASPAS